MSLLTIEEFLQQSILQRKDPEVIEIFDEVGLPTEDIRNFLQVNESTENKEHYGTFWKRFMQYLMESKIAKIPMLYGIMNPMRLALQNLKDPITVMDLKYENQLNGGTQALDLTPVCFIDQKTLSRYLSLNTNTPSTNTVIQLLNAYEISIQQISSYRGVDVAMGNILFDEVHDEHLEQSVSWISCDGSPSVILDVNIDLLLLLGRELKYSYEIWKKVFAGKTPNMERHNVQVNKLIRDYVNVEGLSFLNLKGFGIVKVISSPHQEPIQLQYVYGFICFLEIDSKYVSNYEQYLKTHERRQSELLEQQQQQAIHTSEIDETRRRRSKPFLSPPTIPASNNTSPPPVPTSAPSKAKTTAIAAHYSAPANRNSFDSLTHTPNRSHSNDQGEAANRNRSDSHSQNHSRSLSQSTEEAIADQLEKPNIQSPGIMNEHLTPEKGIAEMDHQSIVSPPVGGSIETAKQLGSVSYSLDFEEKDNMTLKERRELRKRKEEYEKQRKLQEFLRVDGSSADYLPSVHSLDVRDPNSNNLAAASTDQGQGQGKPVPRKSVKDRFMIAQLSQQEHENERLAKFKNDPNKRINTSNVSEVRSKWSETVSPDGTSSLYSASQDPNHLHSAGLHQENDEKRGLQKNKLRNKWEEALHETKNTENSRFQNRKLHTISQFRVTQGTGIVKKRIGEWEELFLQIAATAEQLEEFLRAAHALSERNEFDGMSFDQILELQQQFLDSCQIPEDFIINDTHIYSSKVLNPIIHSYLKKALIDNKTNHFSLSCGVYGETASKPPIDVFAAAIKTNQGKIYVALTVKAAIGKDLDINVYGLKKVTVFGKDLQTNVFEKILNILPMPGWEAWIAEGHYEEMRSIVNYSKPSASRNTSFYDITTSSSNNNNNNNNNPHDITGGADGVGGTIPRNSLARPNNLLDDFDMIEETHDTYTAEEEDRDSLVRNSLNEGTDLKEEAIGKSDMKEELLEDVDLSANEGKDLVEAVEDLPVETASADELKDNNNPHTTAGKRWSTGSAISDLPGDEGEGTWATTLTPTTLTPNTFDRLPPGHPEENLPSTQLENDLQETSEVAGDKESGDRDEEEQEDKDGAIAAGMANVSSHSIDGEEEAAASHSIISHNKSNESHDRPIGNIIGEFSDDEDDEEDDRDESTNDDDDNEEHYHFGKSPVLVSATIARSYLPASTIPTNFMRSKHNQNKFSWPIEAELETRLDTAGHEFVYLNLRDVRNCFVSSNFFIIQGQRSSSIFTGTLAHATTETVYVLEGDRVFEWIRGAAASGWCWKFPMKSQNFGRLRKRFFILRDNVLSYHKTKPKHEEDIASSFSFNTLHLTDNSTVSIGRKRFQRCLIIATPLDTLWLKMKKDFTAEVVKWTNEITKAIQHFSRPKLIMTKSRIESKWYHESPSFSLVNVDVVTGSVGSFGMNLSEEEHSSYCKVALFCLKINIHQTSRSRFSVLPSSGNSTDPDIEQDLNAYSVDIATNDTQRLQLEILNEDETVNLANRLSIVKVYGDYLLFGGNKGLLSLGVLSKTKASTMVLAADGAKDGQRGGSVSVSTSKRVVFTIPLIDKLLETAMEDHNERRKSSNVNSNPNSVQDSAALSGGRAAALSNYPHSSSSEITAIAIASYTSIFAAADSNNIISLWYLPRNPKLGNLSIRSSVSNPTGLKKLFKRLRVYVITLINIKQCDSFFAQQTDTHKPAVNKKRSSVKNADTESDMSERIVKMQFLYQDSYLLVCTNRRMLLLAIQYQQAAPAGFPGANFTASAASSSSSSSYAQYVPQQSFEEAYSRGNSMDINSWQNSGALKSVFSSSFSNHSSRPVRNVVGFSGWVELDRAVPRCYGIFDFFISDEYFDILPNFGVSPSTMRQQGPTRKIVQWRAAEIDDEDEGKESEKNASLASKLKNLVPPTTSSSEALLRKCTVSRLQWTETMFEAALAKLKPCPAFLFEV